MYSIISERHNEGIYEPKVEHKRPEIDKQESDLMIKIGLDGVVFLRFVRMFWQLFFSIALIVCGSLIPVNITYNLSYIPKTNRDILSMLTIRDVSGNSLYVHIVVTYFITGLAILFTYINWMQVMNLHLQWIQRSLYNPSIHTHL